MPNVSSLSSVNARAALYTFIPYVPVSTAPSYDGFSADFGGDTVAKSIQLNLSTTLTAVFPYHIHQPLSNFGFCELSVLASKVRTTDEVAGWSRHVAELALPFVAAATIQDRLHTGSQSFKSRWRVKQSKGGLESTMRHISLSSSFLLWTPLTQ